MLNKKTIISLTIIFIFLTLYGVWSNGSLDRHLPFIVTSDGWNIHERGTNNSITPTCAIENCHGMDIICGSNPPQACTMMYQLGDKCRQFAECGIVSGSCQFIQNKEFSECVSCVKRCEQVFSDSIDKAFECESEC